MNNIGHSYWKNILKLSVCFALNCRSLSACFIAYRSKFKFHIKRYSYKRDHKNQSWTLCAGRVSCMKAWPHLSDINFRSSWGRYFSFSGYQPIVVMEPGNQNWSPSPPTAWLKGVQSLLVQRKRSWKMGYLITGSLNLGPTQPTLHNIL